MKLRAPSIILIAALIAAVSLCGFAMSIPVHQQAVHASSHETTPAQTTPHSHTDMSRSLGSGAVVFFILTLLLATAVLLGILTPEPEQPLTLALIDARERSPDAPERVWLSHHYRAPPRP